METEIDDLITKAPAPDYLTQRRYEVLVLLARGFSTREVAHILEISQKTADSHRAAVLRELHLRNVADVTRYAIHHKLPVFTQSTHVPPCAVAILATTAETIVNLAETARHQP